MSPRQRFFSKSIKVTLFIPLLTLRRDPGAAAHIEKIISTVVVFASGGHPVAKFGSQDVAAMTNHHLLLLVFYSCRMFYLAGKKKPGCR